MIEFKAVFPAVVACILQIVMLYQRSHRALRQKLLHAHDGEMVEGREQHAVFHAEASDHFRQLFLDLRIIDDAGLQLHVGDKVRFRDPLAVFLKGRDPLRRKGAALDHGCIQGLQFGERIVLNVTFAVSCAVERFVMDDDKLPVLRELNIQLDPVCTGLFRFPEGEHGVFRISAAVASVCEYSHDPVLLNSSVLCFYITNSILQCQWFAKLFG